MEQKPRTLQVSVVGGSDSDKATLLLAESVGRTIAERGAILICGGFGGVMEAAARGAKEKGGLTVGILSNYKKETANPFIDVTIPTGLGHSRNFIVAAAGDIVVALAGSHGTRSEVSAALILGKRVVGIKAWGEIEGVHWVDTIAELKEYILPKF